jgi:hypothetical protein
MDEKVQTFMAAHPEVTDAENALLQVRKNEQKILDNKMKSSNFKLISDSELASYRGLRTKFYKEAQEAKTAGKDMTPAQAISVLNHADAMARVDLGLDLDNMDADEAHGALLSQSNIWLQNNVGLNRDEIRQIIKKKPTSAPAISDRVKAAKDSLLKPPTSGTPPVPNKGGGKPAASKRSGQTTSPP